MDGIAADRVMPESYEENGLRYEPYRDEDHLELIKEMMDRDLSEPYSVYTYRFFINACPNLCWVVTDVETEQMVGAIVCRLDKHTKSTVPTWRGYIAMLAVAKTHRKKRIGTKLVERAIEEMVVGNCEEVVLETEITNKGALALYENLGFIRDKRLRSYYLNGQDAFRLKMPLRHVHGR